MKRNLEYEERDFYKPLMEIKEPSTLSYISLLALVAVLSLSTPPILFNLTQDFAVYIVLTGIFELALASSGFLASLSYIHHKDAYLISGMEEFEQDFSFRFPESEEQSVSEHLNRVFALKQHQEKDYSLVEIAEELHSAQILCSGMLNGNVDRNAMNLRKLSSILSAAQSRTHSKPYNRTWKMGTSYPVQLIREISEEYADSLGDYTFKTDLPYQDDAVIGYVPEKSVASVVSTVYDEAICLLAPIRKTEVEVALVINTSGNISSLRVKFAFVSDEDEELNVETISNAFQKAILNATPQEIIIEKVKANRAGVLISMSIPISSTLCE